MPIAYSAQAQYLGDPTGAVFTQEYDSGAGDNRLLIVGIVNVSGTGNYCIGVTYNGVPMIAVNAGVTTNQFVKVYYLFAPATGSNNIVASFSTSVAERIFAVTYTGVDQINPIDANDATVWANNLSEVTPIVTVVASNCWLVSLVTANRAVSAGVGCIKRGTNSEAAFFDSDGVVATGSQHFHVSVTTSNNPTGTVQFSIAPVAVIAPKGNFLNLF